MRIRLVQFAVAAILAAAAAAAAKPVRIYTKIQTRMSAVVIYYRTRRSPSS